jgi:hypothetical protein
MPTNPKKKNVEEILKKAFDLGFEYEKVYMGCSQCVLAAIQDLFEKKNDEVFRAASGLAGGVGLCGDGCCGAYTGGVMALSQLYGRTREKFLDPEYAKFEKAGAHEEKCPSVVGNGARWVAEILLEEADS